MKTDRLGDGVVLDAMNPAGRPSALALIGAGVSLVRLTAFMNDLFITYIKELQAAGISVAVVLARESFPAFTQHAWHEARMASRARSLASAVSPEAWIIGNEPDVEGEASWTLPADEYGALWQVVAPELSGLKLIAGQGSGRTEWLEKLSGGILAEADGIDVHTYNKTADQVWKLLGDFTKFQKPLYVFEWSREAEEVHDHVLTYRELTAGSTNFCWSDGMVPGFGLLTASGTKTSAYWALRSALFR